jgi:hypothetical protein
MKNTFAKYGRSIVATFFVAIMVAGPLCALGGVIISSFGVNLVALIARAVFLA